MCMYIYIYISVFLHWFTHTTMNTELLADQLLGIVHNYKQS